MLRAVRTRSAAELLLLAEAGIVVLLATIAVKLLPFRITTRLIGLIEGAEPTDVTDDQLAAAERVGWAVQAWSARTPWTSTCLMQATAGAALLRRRRIPARLHLGVIRDPDDHEALLAHAWISCGAQVLTGDEPDLGRYAVVGVYSVPGV